MKRTIAEKWLWPIGVLAVVLFTTGWALAKPYRLTLHIDSQRALSGQSGPAYTQMRMVIHNVSRQNLIIEFKNPAVVFEVYQAGKQVYLSTEGRFYTQEIRRREIPVGDQLDFSDTVQLPPGMYEAKATLRMKDKSKWIQKTLSTFFEVHL